MPQQFMHSFRLDTANQSTDAMWKSTILSICLKEIKMGISLIPTIRLF